MEILTKIENATDEQLLQNSFIEEQLLNGLCEIKISKNQDLQKLLKKLCSFYEEHTSENIEMLKIKLDSMLFQISCLHTKEEGYKPTEAKIPECFEYAYFWHYFFAIAFPLAEEDDDSLNDLIQDQYPLVEIWLEELFKDEPLQLELDEQVLTIQFEAEEVKYKLDDEPIYALFDFNTLVSLTKDDEVLFMLLLPVVINEYSSKLEGDLIKILEEFPLYKGLHKKIASLIVKHITTEV